MISEAEHKIYARRARYKHLMEEGQTELAYGTVNDHYYRDTGYLLDRVNGLVKANAELQAEYKEQAEFIKKEVVYCRECVKRIRGIRPGDGIVD